MMQTIIKDLKSKILAGVLPAMATPLQSNNYSINEPVVDQLVNFLIQAGVKGLFIGGTTGEGILLSTEERRKLHVCAIAATSNRVPLLLHVGANTTDESVQLAGHAESLGADAIVAVTPYYYSIHDAAQLKHYHAIASAAPNTPLFVYDIPHLAVNGISSQLLLQLSAEIPSFAGVKCSNQDAQLVRQLIDTLPEEKMILVGNERIALGSLALGAHGVISGLATALPEPFVRLTMAFSSDDLSQALQTQRLINQILDLLPPGARIGAIKSLLSQRGIQVGLPVPPRPGPPDNWQAWQQIDMWLNQVSS